MKRRRIDVGFAVTVLVAIIPAVTLTIYWARTECIGPFDRFISPRGGVRTPDLGPGGTVDVGVDARGMGTPISPLIYGVAFADSSVLRRLGATVNRWGGNTATTFNPVNQCWNAARDWEFRNKPAGDPDDFVRQTLAAGATPLITIPTIGWVSRDCSNGTRSVDVPGHAGIPLSPGSPAIQGYEPARNRATATPRVCTADMKQK